MVVGCVITEECALAVSADRIWKVACSGEAMLKAYVGLINSVNVEGDGGPGTVNTMTLNVASGGDVMMGHVMACDDVARVLRNEVLESGKVTDQLKSVVNEVKLEVARDGACVAKLTVEYKRNDGGGPLVPEDQAALVGGYVGMLKLIEAYLIANPSEYA